MDTGAKVVENTGVWWSYTPMQLIPPIHPLIGTRGRSFYTSELGHLDTFAPRVRCRMDS